MRYTFKTKFNVFLTGTLAVFMASCNPLGELTRTDDPYCFNAPNSVNGVCIDTDDTTQTITVDQTDDDNSATGFGGGSHTGTAYQSGVLTLNTTTNNAELDESWTPQWDNLVSYWKMDEASWNGTANEAVDSKGSNHGVRVGDATTTSSAKIGTYAGTFDGAGDLVTIGNKPDLDLTNNFTISAWVYPRTLVGAFISIFGKRNNASGYQYQLRIQASQYLSFLSSTGGYNGTGTIIANTWNHLLVTYSSGTITLYLNGAFDGSSSGHTITSKAIAVEIGGNDLSHYLDGVIDDVAFWNTPLTADEVALIYSRQSAKYAGEMQSRIIDSQSTNSSWTNLDWITTLPFGKELPDGGGAANSESSADYSNLYSDALMDGIVGLWHMNGSQGTIADDTVISDASGHTNHGAAKDVDGTNTIAYSKSKFAQGINLDGANDYINLGNNDSLNIRTNDFTISTWISTTADVGTIIGKSRYASDYGRWSLGIGSPNDGQVNFLIHWAGGVATYNSSVVVNDGLFHHIAVVIDRDEVLKIYIDGIEDINTNILAGNGTDLQQTNLVLIGAYQNATGTGPGGDATYTFFNGVIDETAVWRRALLPDEVLQLYRRGANRIKYQVRSCASADCTDQNSEDGFGWKGPGGNYLTYFSELYNNSSISSNCVIPQACFGSELSLDGDVQTESPSIRFDDFGADGIYMNNARYFQYRVIMESDDENTACAGGTTCMPELKSVEIGPAHTFEQ
ncbi:LamG domain-containing protein [Bacteriovoracaceae bacterium]|nr:LamG domain-containing protein [Bacteriovoracaceae bacterium]